MLNLHLQIDPHTGVPVYRQVMDQLRHYIASGALPPGSQLPSIRQLAQTLAVNPTTVVKAYGELQHAGVIEMKHGKGVFVADGRPRMTSEQKKETLRRIARQLAVEAAQMGATPEMAMRIVEEELANVKTPTPQTRPKP